MKVFIFGKNAKKIEGLILSFGFVITKNNPEVIISYGGDGTLLSGERRFPQIPKLPIRDSENCIRCPVHQEEVVLLKLKKGALNLKKYKKLKAEFKRNSLLAVNDIVIRNALPTDAIRFLVSKNDTLFQTNPFIGDGIVASTVFGATGYFKSITKSTFTKNFQLAFNNTVASAKIVEFKEGELLQVEITRGPATLSSDNDPKIFRLNKNDKVLIQPSNLFANIYAAENLSCPDCQPLSQGTNFR